MKRCISGTWVLASIFLAVFSLALVTAASAQPGEFVKGVLQPLADGFPKRAINLIVVDDPGSRDDLYAKSLQASLKGISPVTITVSTEPSAMGGSWITLQDVLKREGGSEGYYPIVIATFGMVTDLMTEPYTKKIGAKLDQLNQIISTEMFPYVVIQRKNVPWGPTFAGMVKYAKANPGKLRYISREVGSAFDIVSEWIMKDFGIKAEKIPQGSYQEVVSTIGAGLGDFSVMAMDVTITNWQAGVIDATAVLADTVPPPWDKNPNVVSAKQAGLPNVGTILGLGVPSQVPQSHVDWLYKLFKAGATTDTHKKRAEVLPGLVWDIKTGAQANAFNRELFKSVDPVVHAIGLHVDDIKKK